MQYLADEAELQLQEVDDGVMLDVEQLDAISKVAVLHSVRPANAGPLLRIKCGAASYTDMIGITALSIALYTPPSADYSYNFGGYKLEATITTVVRNGLTGEGVWPKMPMPTQEHPDAVDERYTLAERSAITEHFKAELAQPWSTCAIAHPLRAAGWCQLPPGKGRLPMAVAITGPRKRRPKFEREAEEAERAEKRAARAEQKASQHVAWRGRADRAKGRK